LKLLRAIIYLLVLLLLSPCASADSGQDYVIVVHKESSVDALNSKELRRVFLGKISRWPDGSMALPVLNPKASIHDEFSRSILRKSPAQLSTYWRKNLFSGRSMMPYMAKNTEDLFAYLERHKNAISYLPVSELDDSLKQVRIAR